MRKSLFAAVAVALFGMVGAAQSATLTGTFSVTAVNVLDRTSAQSEATTANFTAALTAAQANTAGYAWDIFTYTGKIFFGTDNGPSTNSATTIEQWLLSAGGGVSDLDLAFGALQQSKGKISDGTATTTFYVFTAAFPIGPSDFTVTHDDGFAIFRNSALVGGFQGPNTVLTTAVPGYAGGGVFDLLYVATNSDPSILKVDVAPVPLPAALPLLAAGLGGLVVMRLRRKAA